MRTKSLFGIALGILIAVWAGCLPAQVRGEDPHQSPRRPAIVPYGVPLAPPIYFVNFLILYFANPATAAMMPAYRVPLPQPVYNCLLANPDGCPYEAMAKYFRWQASEWVDRRDTSTVYPPMCQTTEPWRSLAPPGYQHPDQINEPLGTDRAAKLAKALGIVDSGMTLSKSEYQCVMGAPREIRLKKSSMPASSTSLPRREMGSSSPFRVTASTSMRKETSSAFALRTRPVSKPTRCFCSCRRSLTVVGSPESWRDC